MDLVSQYVYGIDIYKCDKKGNMINEPFFEVCKSYKKDSFSRRGIFKWFADWLHHNRK